jgi:hypothetical protein
VPKTVSLAVQFKLHDREFQPLAGIPVRLVFGTPDWQSPTAGHSFVTDSAGEAQFTTPAVLDRQTRWVNIGFTPLSIPRRTDHLMIAAELPRTFSNAGETKTIQWLYLMSVWRFSDGRCSTYDITGVLRRDERGNFSSRVPRSPIDPSNALHVSEMAEEFDTRIAYQSSDFTLHPDPEDPSGNRWTLSLKYKVYARALIMGEEAPA